MSRAYPLILIALFAAIAAFNLDFLRRDTSPFLFDECMYFEQSHMMQRAADYLSRGGRIDAHIRGIFKEQFSPVVPALVYGICSLTGFTEDNACLVELPFLLILMLSLYGLGKRLYGADCGFWAVIILLCFPFVVAMSRVLYLDLPMTALVALSLWALAASEGFALRRYSVLFGAAFALAFLVKVQSAVFVAGPLAVTLLRGLRPAAGRRTAAVNAALAAAVFAAISAPLYVPLIPSIVGQYGRLFDAPQKLNRPPALAAWQDYLQLLRERLLLPFFFTAFVLAVPLLVARVRRASLFLLSWIAVPYACFSLLVMFYITKAARFLLPCLPAVALIISAAVFSFRDRRVRALLLAAVVAAGLATYGYLYFGRGGRHPLLCTDLFHHGEGRYVIHTDDLKTAEISGLLLKTPGGKEPLRVLTMYSCDMINSPLRKRLSNRTSAPFFTFDAYVDSLSGGYEDMEDDSFYARKVGEADIVIVKSGYTGPATRSGRFRSGLEKLHDAFNADRGFVPAGQVNLFDGSILFIYSRQGAGK